MRSRCDSGQPIEIGNHLRTKSPLYAIAIAIGILFTSMLGGPATALEAPIPAGGGTLVSAAASTSQQTPTASSAQSSPVSSPATASGGAWCGPSNTPANFAGMERYLNVKFGQRNKNQVWRASSNIEVWRVYCFASGGKAKMGYHGNRLTSLTPSYIRLSDGTRVDFRITSSSGGWTVDINRPGVSKLYKVHVG